MKTLLTFLLLISLTNTVFAAGSDSDDTVVKPKNYSKVKKLIKKEKYSEAIKKLEEIAISNNCKFIKSYTNFLAIDCGYDGIFAKNVLDFLISNGIFVRMPFTSPENRCIRVSAGTDKDLKLFKEKFPLALSNAKKKLNLK